MSTARRAVARASSSVAWHSFSTSRGALALGQVIDDRAYFLSQGIGQPAHRFGLFFKLQQASATIIHGTAQSIDKTAQIVAQILDDGG